VSGVLQGADDLLAAVERFEAGPRTKTACSYGAWAEKPGTCWICGKSAGDHGLRDDFTIGTRVAEWFGGRHGVVESRRDEYHDLWPVGVRFDDGKYEACAASELRVERSAVIA
jgi:hypothetical protein